MSELTLALSALTGGTTGALDKIDGAGLSDGDAAVVVLSTGVYHYHLNATSGATESSPYVISPDTNAGTKRWILVTPMGPMSRVEAKQTSGQSVPVSDQTIIYDTEITDVLAEYSTSTGIFTATYTGRYLVCAQIQFSSIAMTLGDDFRMFIDVEGAHAKRGVQNRYPTTTGTFGLAVASMVALTAADELEIVITQDIGTTSLTTTDNANWLTIDRIS